jgi:two-component system, NtrC family, nitrogen regulation response regulator NtrX
MSTLQLDHEAPVAVPATVLLVAAGARDRGVVGECLGRLGISLSRARDAGEALVALTAHPFALCIVDLADERAAIASIRTLRAEHPRLSIVGVIDPDRPVAAAEAIHAGVSDLLPWPFENHDVAAAVANACDAASVGLTSFARTVAAQPARLVAHSLAMRQVMELIAAAAEARGGVIICGEPGTGREVAAQVIHAQSPRSTGPFVSIDCRSASPDDLELQLFGCPPERQATGAPRRTTERIARTSAVYEARGGTLFLSNVVEAPARAQAKLARLIRDCEAVLPDRRTVVDVDVRLIAAFEQNPEVSLTDGRLRRDLYERLAHTQIEMPPLRRRREDIPLLIGYFLSEQTSVSEVPPRFTRSALALLSALPWPGNGRELRSVLDALVKRADRPVIGLEDVLEHVHLSGSATRLDPDGTLRDAKARFEREWISAVLVKHNGRVGDAARALGIQRTNLYRKVRQLNVARALLVRKL